MSKADVLYGKGAHIEPAYDSVKVTSSQTGVPTSRRSSNSTTTAHINHGAAGVSAGEGQWGAQAAHHAYAKYQHDKQLYESSHSPAHQAHDRQLSDAAGRWYRETHGDAAYREFGDHMQKHGLAYDPVILKLGRERGTEQMKLEAERASARGVEKQQGRKPQPAVPHHPQQDTRAAQATRPSNAKQLYRHSTAA